MAVTARVVCSSVTAFQSGRTTVKFQADYQDGRNKEWADSTPSLEFAMSLAPSAAHLFEAGKKYAVTFEENQV